jgi:PTH1 family peptidyl-tRNA hydrolase
VKLIVFQGNPGLKYRRTRHNIGFMLGDKLAKIYHTRYKFNKKFNADVAEVVIDGQKVLLAKPQTFYNRTGLSVRRIIDFYNLNPRQDLLVVCDDLNLAFGQIRLREQGSDGGNNGLKSIIEQLGPEFARLRLGTDNELRGTIGDTDFVLSRFSKVEWEEMPEILVKANKIIRDFID